MPGVLLSVEDRVCFVAALRRHGNGAVRLRMNALLLLDDGWTAERVAEAPPGSSAPIRRGARAVPPSNHGRVNVTLNGALSWPAREVITREASKITNPEMVALFAAIEARHPIAAASL